MLRFELLFCEPEHEAGLAHARVSDDNELEEVVVVIAHIASHTINYNQ